MSRGMTPADCPRRALHRQFAGTTCDGCDAAIPAGPFSPDERVRYALDLPRSKHRASGVFRPTTKRSRPSQRGRSPVRGRSWLCVSFSAPRRSEATLGIGTTPRESTRWATSSVTKRGTARARPRTRLRLEQLVKRGKRPIRSLVRRRSGARGSASAGTRAYERRCSRRRRRVSRQASSSASLAPYSGDRLPGVGGGGG